MLTLNNSTKLYFSHPSAYIDAPSEIGARTKIWHFTHIQENARIGEDCVLGQNVNIGRNVKIGSRVKIQNNVSVYEGCEVEDDVFLGPSCVFTNVINPRSEVDRRDSFQKTIIKKGATVGANATILCGITLGEYCFIGAGAVVTKDVPNFALMVGNPASQTGWMSKAGCKLQEDENQNYVCPETKELYKLKDGFLELI